MELCGTELPFHSFSSCDWLSASSDECVENKKLDVELLFVRYHHNLRSSVRFSVVNTGWIAEQARS